MPLAAFWHAAHRHPTGPEELFNLAEATKQRHCLQWADALYRRAADAGSATPPADLSVQRESAGDWDGAYDFAQRAADAGITNALFHLSTWPECLVSRRRLRQAGSDNAASN